MNSPRRLSPPHDEAAPVPALEPIETTQGHRFSLNQMERIREIHRLIRRFTDNPEHVLHRVTDPSLAEKLEVSDRQIRRDRAVLERLIGERDDQRGNGGLPSTLEFDTKRLSWRYTREVDLSVWVGQLDDDELGSLLVAQQALAVFSGMPLARHVSHIFEEDASELIGNQRSALREEITQLVSFHPEGARRIDPDTFATIFRGLLLQQQVEVSYLSKQASAPAKRVRHPYHLCCYKHQWRIIAYDGKSDAIRSFVVTPRRLKSVRLLDHGFKRPKSFTPHDQLGLEHVPSQTITLRIGRDGAHHILEGNWHGLRATREVADGALEATFDIADLGEFKRFVLAFGSDCEVLSPAAFRDDIRNEAWKMLPAENPRDLPGAHAHRTDSLRSTPRRSALHRRAPPGPDSPRIESARLGTIQPESARRTRTGLAPACSAPPSAGTDPARHRRAPFGLASTTNASLVSWNDCRAVSQKNVSFMLPGHALSVCRAHSVLMNTNHRSEAGITAKTKNQAAAQSQPIAATQISTAAGAAAGAQRRRNAESLAFLRRSAELGAVVARAGNSFQGAFMAGKPVVEVDSKTVINFNSGFSHKKLCDGLTFTAGSACVYSCAFCYVEDLMRKNPHGLQHPEDHQHLVIRRRNAVEVARRQLTYKDGRARFPDPEDRRVIYASPLVDVAANRELARETIEICRVILERTSWHIRLLSKSNLLPRIAEELEPYRDRMIYGVSTGTLDDRLGASFEKGTALVSKRIASLHQLQDAGFRTYAMVCPSLPLPDERAYRDFAERAAEALRTDRCEHVWAEVLNVRGESMTKTCAALREAGFAEAADRLEAVSTDRAAWEDYARQTFEAHAQLYEARGESAKLRFMQYVGRGTRAYWESQVARGAVLL